MRPPGLPGNSFRARRRGSRRKSRDEWRPCALATARVCADFSNADIERRSHRTGRAAVHGIPRCLTFRTGSGLPAAEPGRFHAATSGSHVEIGGLTASGSVRPRVAGLRYISISWSDNTIDPAAIAAAGRSNGSSPGRMTSGGRSCDTSTTSQTSSISSTSGTCIYCPEGILEVGSRAFRPICLPGGLT